MVCSNCGTAVTTNASFCPNCGTGLVSNANANASASSPAYGTSQPAYSTLSPGMAMYAGQREETGRRVLAYLIDAVPIVLLAVLHLLPVIGWMLYGLIHACYWLLRDYNGASIGKSVMGSMVVDESGGPATTQQRILRNLPLAIPGLLGMIPFIGIFIEAGFAVVIFTGEAILLLATGRRLGDRIAGTNVYHR
jgi:uncharacterized RDD family membrane protein YckC